MVDRARRKGGWRVPGTAFLAPLALALLLIVPPVALGRAEGTPKAPVGPSDGGKAPELLGAVARTPPNAAAPARTWFPVANPQQNVNASFLLSGDSWVPGDPTGPTPMYAPFAADDQGNLLIADFGSQIIYRVNSTTHVVTGAGAFPDVDGPIFYDPSRDVVFADNRSESGIIEASASTLALVRNIPTPLYASLIAFDPVGQLAYFVFGGATSNVSAYNVSSGAYLWDLAYIGEPDTAVLDPLDHLLFIDSIDGAPIQEISTTTHQRVGTLTGSFIGGGTFDPVDGDLYLGSNPLEVFDPSTNRTVQSVPLPADPLSLLAAPDTGDVYLGTWHGVYCLPLGSTTPVFVGPTIYPVQGMVAIPELHAVVWLNWTGDALEYYSTATRAPTGSFPVGTSPQTLLFDPEVDAVVVGGGATGELFVVSAKTGLLVRTVNVIGETGVWTNIETGVYDRPSHALYFVSNGNVTVLNASTFALLAEVPGAGVDWLDFPPSYQASIADDPIDHEVFVAPSYNDSVEVIDTQTLAPVAQFLAGSVPFGTSGMLCMDTKLDRLWVMGGATNYVLNASTGTVVATPTLPGGSFDDSLCEPSLREVFVDDGGEVNAISLDSYATEATGLGSGWQYPQMTYDPTDGVLYRIDTQGGSVEAFNATTMSWIETVPTGRLPSDILYVSPQEGIWVADPGSGALRQISPLFQSVFYVQTHRQCGADTLDGTLLQNATRILLEVGNHTLTSGTCPLGFVRVGWNTSSALAVEGLPPSAGLSVEGQGTLLQEDDGPWPVLTVGIAPTDGGTLSGSLALPIVGTRTLPPAVYWLNATASPHYEWSTWLLTGGIAPPSYGAPSLEFTLSSNATVDAEFQYVLPPVVNVELLDSPAAGGEVSLNGSAALDSGAEASLREGVYPLEAFPASGYAFQGWQSSAGLLLSNTTELSVAVNVTVAGTITALFQKVTSPTPPPVTLPPIVVTPPVNASVTHPPAFNVLWLLLVVVVIAVAVVLAWIALSRRRRRTFEPRMFEPAPPAYLPSSPPTAWPGAESPPLERPPAEAPPWPPG